MSQVTRVVYALTHDRADNAEWVASEEALFRESVNRVYPDMKLLKAMFTCPKDVVMAARTDIYDTMRRTYRGNLIFLDTDIIFLRPLPRDFWDGPWSVGLVGSRVATLLMPFNGGVIFSKDTVESQKFFSDVKAASTDVSQGLINNNWFIDQLAMRYAYEQQTKATFKTFPWSHYNYTPDLDPRDFDRDEPEAHIVHLKGNRKHLMPHYLNKCKELNAWS